MSQNGILDFQSTDKVRFVGSTSNIVLDTVNASLGIGLVTDDLLKSNLQIVGNAHITAGLTTLGNVAGDKFLGDGSLLTGVAFPADVAALTLDTVAGVNSSTDETIQLTNTTTALEASGNVELDSSQLIFKSEIQAASPGTQWTYADEHDGSTDTNPVSVNHEFSTALSSTPDGNRILVGIGSGGSSSNAGQVRVYDWDAGTSTWNQVGNDIEGINGYDRLAWSSPNHYSGGGGAAEISADGTTIIAGASSWSSSAGSQTGYAVVYKLISGTWTRIVGIAQPVGTGGGNGPIVGELYGSAQYERYGHAVDISADGTRVVIGAYGHSSPAIVGENGRVQVFDWDGSNWVQAGADLIGLYSGDRYGMSVAISDSGSTIAVGAPGGMRDSSPIHNGYIDVLDWDGSQWNKRNIGSGGAGKGNDGGAGTGFTLTGVSIYGVQYQSLFGTVVKLSADGTIVAASATKRGGAAITNQLTFPNRTGSARVFTYNASTDRYSVVGVIDGKAAELAHDGVTLDSSVTMSSSSVTMQIDMSSTGDYVALGYPLHRPTSGIGSGSVYVYQLIGDTWTLYDHRISSTDFTEIPDSQNNAYDYYLGRSLALADGGSKIVMGTKNDSTGPGQIITVTNGYQAAITGEIPVEMVSTTLTVHGNLQATSFLGDGTKLTGVALATDLADNSSRITDLSNEIDNLDIESALARSNLATELADNSSRINTLRLNLIDNSSRIVNTNTDVTDNAARITVLEVDLGDNASRITTLEQANIVQEGLIDNLRTDVDNFVVAQQAAGGDQSLNLADNAARITVLETDVADNSSRLDDLIALEEDANTVQSGLIDDLRTDVDSNANRVSFISAAGDTTVIASNLDVTGNIFFRGERFVVDSETKVISDPIMGLANNNTLSTTDIGLIMQRPEANVALVHHGSSDATNPDQFTIGYTQSSIEDSEVTVDTGNVITVNILGNLITQDTITAATFLGDGTQLTGVALQTDLADNTSRIGTLESDIADLEAATTAAGGDTAGNLLNNAARITTLEDDLADNSTRIAELTFGDVVDVSNVSSNTIQLTNADTGLVTSGDIVVGKTITSTSSFVSNAATIGATKTFTVTADGGYYLIDGVTQAALTLSQGQTYIFDVSSSTLSNHAIAFSTGGTDGAGSAYSDGLTLSWQQPVARFAGTAGAIITFVVPTTGTSTVSYYCTSHSGMGSDLTIVDSAELIVSGTVEATAFIGSGTQLTGVAFPADVNALTLDAVSTVSNTTGQTIELTNTDTSLAVSGNVAFVSETVINIPGTEWEFENSFNGGFTTVADGFGGGLTITPDGTRMVATALGADANGSDSGVAKIYDWNDSTSSWVQNGANITGLGSGDKLGQGAWPTDSGWDTAAISTDGNTVAIGAYRGQPGITPVDPGYVIVYRLIGGTWTRLEGGITVNGSLTSNNKYGGFGAAVSLSADGNRMIVGSPRNPRFQTQTDINNNVAGWDGDVFVYDWDGSQWSQVGTTFESTSDGEHLGTSVDISADGNTIAMGAPGRSAFDQNSSTLGFVNVFDWDGSTWNQRNLDGSNNGTDGGAGTANAGQYKSIISAEQDSEFGSKVRLSSDGTILAVGSPRRFIQNPSPDGNGGTRQGFTNGLGSIRVFSYDAGSDSYSTLGDEITTPEAAGWSSTSAASAYGMDSSKAMIGTEMSSTGDLVAISFPFHTSGGYVYAFKYDAGNWTLFDHKISRTDFPEIIQDKNRAELGKSIALADGGTRLLAATVGGQYSSATSSADPTIVTFANGSQEGTAITELPLQMLAATTLKVHGNVEANYFTGDGTQLTLPDFAFETDLSDNSSRIDQLIIDVDNLEVATTQTGGDTALNLADNASRIGVLETDVSGLRIDVDSNAERVTYITSTPETTVIASNLDVTGNIFFRGDRFIVDSETKVITDPIMGLANNNTLSSTDIGFVMQRPTANVALIHHGSTSATNAGEFTIGYTQDSLEASEITVDTGNDITVNILGDLITQDTITATKFVGDGSGLAAFAFHIEGVNGQMLDTKAVMNDTNTTLTIGFDHSIDESNASAGFIATPGATRGMYVAPATGVYQVSCRVRLTDYVSSSQTIKWYIRRVGGTEEVYEEFELFVTPGSGLHASTSTTVVKLVQGEAIFPRGDGTDSSISSTTFSGQYIGTY